MTAAERMSPREIVMMSRYIALKCVHKNKLIFIEIAKKRGDLCDESGVKFIRTSLGGSEHEVS